MTGVGGSLRRKLLTPPFSEATLEKRGFHLKDHDSKELLERIGRTFLVGFSHSVAADTPDVVEPLLADVPDRFRGFAYEGAAMGLAVSDALSWRNRSRLSRFVSGSGREHVYMAHVGLGWALARVPRFRWPRAAPDPLLQWLVLDGYGFHEAYFHTARVVTRRTAHPDVPWGDAAHAWYRPRAMDQGVGRALWFAGGTDPDVVADLLERFEPHRHPDLYSGAALAATYAGGVGEAELVRFRERAAHHLPQVAQGCVFAAEARRLAGLEVPQTEVAAEVFCGLSARDAAQVAVDSRPEPEWADGEVPGYEVWRRRIADRFVSQRRV